MADYKIKEPRHTDEFWDWVVKRRVANNPRGDFIEDTRRSIKAGRHPKNRSYLYRSNPEAVAELEKLEKRYKKLTEREKPFFNPLN